MLLMLIEMTAAGASDRWLVKNGRFPVGKRPAITSIASRAVEPLPRQ